MSFPRAERRWWKGLHKTPLVYEIAGAAATAVLGLAAARRYFKDEDYGWGAAAILAILAALGAGIARFLITHREKHKRESPRDLDGALITLFYLLSRLGGGDKGDGGVRLTVHVPVSLPIPGTKRFERKLEQVCDYVASNPLRCTGAGRIFSTHPGAIGVAFRTGDVISGNRLTDNPVAYIADLKSTWHYTEEEARALDPTVMSWIALPMKKSNGQVEAVVFADSQERGYFSVCEQMSREQVDEVQLRRTTFFRACIGIGAFASKRYD